MLLQHSFNSDWLFNAQSRAQKADWLILESIEKATFNVNMPIVLIIMVFDSQLEEGEEFEMETENYNYLLPFIMQCLPAPVSIIQTSQQYDHLTCQRSDASQQR